MASKESEKLQKNRETVKKTNKRQKSNPLPVQTRLEVIEEYERHKTPIRDLANKYNVSASQIQRTLANKNRYVREPSPRAGSSISSPSDGVDFINGILLERDLTEEPSNIDQNKNEDGRNDKNDESLMLNESDSDDDSETTHGTFVDRFSESNENFDGNSLIGSEYATSDSSTLSVDSLGDFKMETTNLSEEQKSSNRLFMEQVCEFMQKKSQQRAKWKARKTKLKQRLQNQKNLAKSLRKKLFDQQEKAKRFEDMATELTNEKIIINCRKCGEMKPKLTFDFCSFKCFQGVLSPCS